MVLKEGLSPRLHFHPKKRDPKNIGSLKITHRSGYRLEYYLVVNDLENTLLFILPFASQYPAKTTYWVFAVSSP